MSPTPVWFIVADAGRSRLLSVRRVPPGRVHVDEHESIENHADSHEHGRPSPRAGKGGNTYASAGHEDEQQLHRFAKEVAAWIAQKLTQHAVERATLFSAPKLLGELRKLYPPGLAQRIQEHPADLTQVSPAALAHHQAILSLLD